MGQQYNQLTKEDRHMIATLKRRKLTQQEIAIEIGFGVVLSPSCLDIYTYANLGFQ